MKTEIYSGSTDGEWFMSNEVRMEYTSKNLSTKVRCRYCRAKQDEDNDLCEHCGAPLPDEMED